MKQQEKINGVLIWDEFYMFWHNLKCKVVDIYKKTSITTNKIKWYICIAKPIEWLATNEFETQFSTVIRNKVNKNP